ncbi:MAG TPA: GAF domain-containing protein [Thermoanaerobaculia bacterium]|nr:GAF domain-containing protein [Thermoanaerobaculia bacterium]
MDDASRLRNRIAELEQRIAALTRDNESLSLQAESLHAASVVTADATDVGRAIKLVLEELRKVVPYDSCSVQQLRGTRLVIIGGVGFADLDVILGESFEIDNFDIPNAEVVHRRRTLIVGDTDQYRAFRRGLHVGNGIRSWLGVPLMFHDELLGMLALDKAEANFYTQDHERLAMAFASMIAQVIAK